MSRAVQAKDRSPSAMRRRLEPEKVLIVSGTIGAGRTLETLDQTLDTAEWTRVRDVKPPASN